MLRHVMTLAALAAAVGLSGCGSCHKSNFIANRPLGCASCGDGMILGRVAPVPAAPPVTRALPPAVDSPPPAAELTPAPDRPAAPPPPATIERPMPPGPAAAPETAEPPPSPPTPDTSAPSATPPEASADARSSPRLGPPGPVTSESASPPRASAAAPSPDTPPVTVPGAAGEQDPDGPDSVDLPSFAIARPGVASGLRPFPDGINWLSKHGYKTVVHLKAPGEDSAAAGRIFEGKGLKYVSLEVSPRALTREVYDEFNRLVTDKDSQPVFVYDRDGSRAGALWYLHFRAYLGQPHEKALAEAKRLGLRPDEDEHKRMFLAAQTLLSTLVR